MKHPILLFIKKNLRFLPTIAVVVLALCVLLRPKPSLSFRDALSVQCKKRNALVAEELNQFVSEHYDESIAFWFSPGFTGPDYKTYGWEIEGYEEKGFDWLPYLGTCRIYTAIRGKKSVPFEEYQRIYQEISEDFPRERFDFPIRFMELQESFPAEGA